ncbi:primosomal protein [Phycicoccus sp. CSK15P-2]|uniref:primosomal protein n=1 Tax=Phycicoccus sp. CSK15P-2 TaxID=2807627 RepID=UPI0019505C04|nr:primosomal protein [Phycicoccus sp. CSK15P-2]MBM6405836.1 primosomal protein [Phycicoccus sp. CSK15P-2]
MSADPRAALAVLVTAFERHLEVSSTRRGEDDPAVVAAYEDLADAFEEYDAALYDAYGEMTPLDIYGTDDELDDHDDEDGDGDRLYAGLSDDIEYDDPDDDPERARS